MAVVANAAYPERRDAASHRSTDIYQAADHELGGRLETKPKLVYYNNKHIDLLYSSFLSILFRTPSQFLSQSVALRINAPACQFVNRVLFVFLVSNRK
jgi:hypothetical protein